MFNILAIFTVLFSISAVDTTSVVVEQKYQEKSAIVDNSATVTADFFERVNQSNYEDILKVEYNAGSSTTMFVGDFCEVTEFAVAKVTADGILFQNCSLNFELAKQQVNNSNNNLVIIQNEKIIYSDAAIINTIGGTSFVGMIYPTPLDALQKNNGRTISGGAFDGAYYETVLMQGEFFFKVKIGGYTGYISSNEAQIIPLEKISHQSYYIVENGELVFYEAIENDLDVYNRYPLSAAPANMIINQKYYSYDNIKYYSTPLTDSIPTVMQNDIIGGASY